ncbi:zinc ribbon domain-containing protein [Intestinimonas sp. HCP28S3_D6]|uniref:zinc ribbon domain-containing protein n=1 Tax=Intestinimonas sp. HCP28S3_D6 TaxID=3438942 RepID=UPI003F8B01EF
MALICCPECGREVSEHVAACIHCGASLNQAQEERFALVLLSVNTDYEGLVQLIQEISKLGDREQIETLLSAPPLLLRRGLTRSEVLSFLKRLGSRATVKLVRDGGETESELLSAPEVSPTSLEGQGRERTLWKWWSGLSVFGGLLLMWCAPVFGMWFRFVYNLRAGGMWAEDSVVFYAFMTAGILLTGLLFAVGGMVLFFRKVLRDI